MQSQFVDFVSQKNNGIKAGLCIRRAAGKRRIILQPIVIYKIAEWKTICKKDCFKLRLFYSCLIFLIEDRQPLLISICILLVKL